LTTLIWQQVLGTSLTALMTAFKLRQRKFPRHRLPGRADLFQNRI